MTCGRRFVTSVLGVQVVADYNNYALYSGTFLDLEKIEELLGSWYVQTVLYSRGPGGSGVVCGVVWWWWC